MWWKATRKQKQNTLIPFDSCGSTCDVKMRKRANQLTTVFFLTQSMFGPAALYVVTFLHYVNQCKHRNMMRLPHMKYRNALFIQKYFHIALLSSNILEHRLSQWLWGGDSTLCSSHLGRWWQIFFILTKTNPSYSIFYILLATKLKMNYWVDTRPIKWLCIQSS